MPITHPVQGDASLIQPMLGPASGGISWAQGPPAVALDADAQAYIDAMTSAPDGDRETIINQFFLDIKGLGDFGTDDIFSKLDVAYLLAAHDEQAGLLDITRGFDATAVNSPTFTVDRGFVSDGSTSFIDTTFIPSSDGVNFTLNDASFGVYLRTDGTSIGAHGAQGGSNANRTLIQPRQIGDTATINVNGAVANDLVVSMTTALGMMVARRTASNALQAFKNGVSVGSSAGASDALTPRVLIILAFRTIATSNHDIRQASFSFIASSLTATEQLNLFNAAEAYLDAIGAGVVA